MDDNDEFDFSDPDLDDLPANTLQQLEYSAILSTQHQGRNAAKAGDSHYGGDDDDDDGDEVINLADESAQQQASPWVAVAPRQHAPVQQYPQQYAQQYSGEQHAQYHDGMEVEAGEPPRRSQVDAQQLLLRIKKLEQDKARLNRDLQSEKSKALSKAGEADTVRRRFEAAQRENDRRMQVLQQAHNDQLAKTRTELEKSRLEREQAQTNSRFLEHDLAQEADKARRVRKTGVASRPKPPASPAGTPRRQKSALSFGDGFDDEDIVMMSPSKNREKTKASTPKQAGKRKRQVADQSPIPALQLSEPRERPKAQEPLNAGEPKLDPSLLDRLQKDDHRFELLHRVVNQRSSNGKDRVLEALTQYALPSTPDKKLSSTVYDELARTALEHDVHGLALRICDIFLALWGNCLHEQYYPPLYLCLDALHFVLACEPSSTAISMAERAVPLIVATIDLVSIPTASAASNPQAAKQLHSPAQREITQNVDVLDCLELLYMIASSCIASSDAIACFWRSIPFDFALVLLHRSQPLSHIMLMLRILSTSALPTTIGAIVSDSSAPDQQSKRENDLIDRLSLLLFEIPEVILDPASTTTKAKSPYSAEQIWTLRNKVLTLLTSFSISEEGSSRLVHNPHCIGRLIKHLDFSVATLYDSPLFPTQGLTIASINATMRLVYHLVTSHPDVDIKSKFGVIHGGNHKYLVALTRLAFSDGLVLEQGIEVDVSDAAHSILDAALSPEEGEGLLQVFSTGASA